MLVVGGAGGIGAVTCEALANQGATPVILDQRSEHAAAVAAAIRDKGLKAAHIEGDALDLGATDRLVEQVVATFGRLDALVYLVPGWLKLRPAIEMPVAEFARTLETTLTAQFAWAQSAAKAMQGSGGSIVLIGSVLGYGGTPRRAPYNASRGGLMQLVRALAVEWARLGIRVNAVAPGWVRTPPLEAMGLPLGRYARRAPMGRLGEPEDVSGAIVYLASPLSGWTTGVTIPVDGGTSAYMGPGDPPDAWE